MAGRKQSPAKNLPMDESAQRNYLGKLEELRRLKKEYRLLSYKPYPKQRQFHNLGTRERALFKANRSGGTFAAGMEVAMHLTGIYPAWWKGVRFSRAVRWGVGSETGDLLKKGPQRMLYGPEGSVGTGTIPKQNLVLPPKMARGVPDGIDTLYVRHMTNGEFDGSQSVALFMSYADGRTKWQSDDWDGAWLDEEPDMDIYTEALTRTNVTTGPLLFSATPLKGTSDVVMRYLNHHAGTGYVQMELEEAAHFSAEQRRAIIDSYPEHEVEARTKGVPILGQGKIFKTPEKSIWHEPFEIPRHFQIIGGLDFGIEHPAAAVKIARNPETDDVFLIEAEKRSGLSPQMHALSLKHWNIPIWAWPHDGNQRRPGEAGSLKQLAQFYRDEGLVLTSEHAQYPDKRGNGVFAAIADVQQRLERGQFRVFSHLKEWMEEYRFYHMKDGQPVAIRDDLLKATMYALMMIRYARQEEAPPKSTRYERFRQRFNTSWMAS